MKGEGYPLKSSQNFTKFEFVSLGVKGKIKKVIVFQCLSNGWWNLAFGDKSDLEDDFDDAVVSNNGDVKKIIQTVVNAVYDFTETYPEREIFIQPVDSRRGTLYNLVFKHHWLAISKNFKVFGSTDFINLVKYNPRFEYQFFLLKRKF